MIYKGKFFYFRLLTIAVMTAVSLSSLAENYNNSKCEQLKQFYIKYQEIWSDDSCLIWWQNSAYRNYVSSHCTPEFFSLMENELTNGVGMDFLTCDYGDTMIMSTMNITVSDSCYIMTFQADWPLATGGSSKKDVTLHIYTENGLINDVIEVVR